MKKQKALAYVTRSSNSGELEILVHEHQDYPEAGIQVPAGTIDPGESPIEAARRETQEECGLSDLEFISEIGTSDYTATHDNNAIHERHFIHFKTNETKDKWDHIVTSGEQDKGLRFLCYFTSLKDDLGLVAEQGLLLGRLR